MVVMFLPGGEKGNVLRRCIEKLRESIEAKKQGDGPGKDRDKVKREKGKKEMQYEKKAKRWREWEKTSYSRKAEIVEEKESGRGREVVGVGGYQGQEQLRSPTPAVPSEGRQWGSRWATSIEQDPRCSSFSRPAAQSWETSVGGGKGGRRSAGITCFTGADAIWKMYL